MPVYPTNNASIKGEGAIKERRIAAGEHRPPRSRSGYNLRHVMVS